jgi:polyferredoxin
MFAGPFIRVNGNPLLMINVVERKFSVLGVIFWPEDNLVFALGFLLFLMGIAVFTAAFGRLWCGWACPQTVLMEMVFRKIDTGSKATVRTKGGSIRRRGPLQRRSRRWQNMRCSSGSHSSSEIHCWLTLSGSTRSN